MEDTETTIQVGDDVYTRVRVTAKLRLADPANTPAPMMERAKAAEEYLWWQDKVNFDLCHVNFILDVEGENNNNDYMPREALVKGFSTARFKPVNMEHTVEENGSMLYIAKGNPIPAKNTIFGVMTNTALANSQGKILTPEEIASLDMTDNFDRPKNEKLTVVAWASLWNFLFPQTVANLIAEVQNRDISVSMEKWLKVYDYMVWNHTASTWNYVTPAAAADNGVEYKYKSRQMVDGRRVYRRALSFVYGGCASTHNPAQPMSRFIAPSMVRSVASGADDEFLKILLSQHGEVHQRFVVSPYEEQSDLIAQHLKITRAISGYVGEIKADESVEVTDVLDLTLPPELQTIVTADKSDASQRTIQTEEEPAMPEPIKNTIDEQAILATARNEAKSLLASERAQEAIAAQIQGLTTAKLVAEQSLVSMKASLEERAGVVAELNKKIEGLQGQVNTLTAQVKESDIAKATASKAVETLAAEKQALVAQLANIEAQKVVASRTELLKSLGDKIATPEKIAWATARNSDGSFAVSDAFITTYVNDMKQAIAAVTPPVDPAASAAALAAAAAAAASKSTPSAPDLAAAQAAQVRQAQAALQGAAPTVSGRKTYAEAFNGKDE